mgnify:CR=1 FL=1
MSNLVHCEFDSAFSAPIETTLDQSRPARVRCHSASGVSPPPAPRRYLFVFLKELASVYRTAALQANTSAGGGAEEGLFSPTLSRTSLSTTVSRALAGGSRRRRDYRCLFFRLEPQIAHLNEVPAPPPPAALPRCGA